MKKFLKQLYKQQNCSNLSKKKKMIPSSLSWVSIRCSSWQRFCSFDLDRKDRLEPEYTWLYLCGNYCELAKAAFIVQGGKRIGRKCFQIILNVFPHVFWSSMVIDIIVQQTPKWNTPRNIIICNLSLYFFPGGIVKITSMK